MSAGKMSDGSPVTPELDARMLADLRAWRKTEHTTREVERGHQVWLDADELDMLLRIADELDALKAAACAMPDERPTRIEIPPGHALIKGEIVPLPPAPGIMHIAGEGGVLCGADRVSHVTNGRRYADCPACIAAFLLPFCDCGSVDTWGDDIGEHGPRCPYHLAVLKLQAHATLSARELDDLCKRTLAAMARA